MKSVVVEVRKGMVTRIYADEKETQFVVVDWDLKENVGPEDMPGFVCDPSQMDSMPNETRTVFQSLIS